MSGENIPQLIRMSFVFKFGCSSLRVGLTENWQWSRPQSNPFLQSVMENVLLIYDTWGNLLVWRCVSNFWARLNVLDPETGNKVPETRWRLVSKGLTLVLTGEAGIREPPIGQVHSCPDLFYFAGAVVRAALAILYFSWKPRRCLNPYHLCTLSRNNVDAL